MRHAQVMDDAKFERLRKAICRSFNSQPHKKKYWLAVLAMHTGRGRVMPGRREPKGLRTTNVHSVDGATSRMCKGRDVDKDLIIK